MKRLYLMDPVCAQPEGHNLTLLRSYKKYFESNFEFDEIKLIVSKQLPFDYEESAIRSFTFSYFGILNLSSVGDDFEYRNYSNTEKEELATAEAVEFLAEHHLCSTDFVFMPGADYFGTLAILRAISFMKPQDAPVLVLRYIGVLENIYGGNRSLQRLLNLTEQLLKSGFDIRVTAETPEYTDHLGFNLGLPLTPSPHPLFNSDIVPHIQGDKRIVALPGSGRLDKGFDRLYDIALEFARESEFSDVHFKVQSLPPKVLKENMNFGVRLYALPNVEIMPPFLTEEEMHDLYASAKVILSPYAQDVYAMRGSAVMVEALDFGRLSVSQNRTAFSGQMEYYRLGRACNSTSEYVNALKGFLLMTESDLDMRATQARHRYQIDVTAAYTELFQ